MGEYDQVRVYGGENLTLTTVVNIPGSSTHPYIRGVGVAVNPKTNKVYATWNGNNTLYMIDGDTHTITKTVRPSVFVPTPVVNSYTNYLYFFSQSVYDSENIVLNGETLEEVMSTDFGELRAIDPIHNFLYTINEVNEGPRLYRIDGTTHSIIDSLLLRDFVRKYSFDPIVVNPKTSKIYIVGKANQIYVFSASAMKDTVPIISILSPENTTYNMYNVTLNFTTSETLLWTQYSLDGQANHAMTGNTTVYELTEGQHTIIVYGEDLGENVGQSQMIQFSIEPIREKLPIDPILVIAVIVLIAIALAAIVSTLIWRKRRKKS